MTAELSADRPHCPECGAPTVDGMTCWEQFGGLLAWEQYDPELSAEHFLTVASYNLQHPSSFTQAALDGLRSAFIAHLDSGLPVPEIRRQMGSRFEGSARVLRPKSERQPILRRWAMTIANVYTPDRPDGAAQRVRDWAASIRSELSEI